MAHITEELVEPVVPREDRVTRQPHQEDLNMIGFLVNLSYSTSVVATTDLN